MVFIPAAVKYDAVYPFFFCATAYQQTDLTGDGAFGFAFTSDSNAVVET